MHDQYTTWERSAGEGKDFVEDLPVQSEKTLPFGDWTNLGAGDGPPEMEDTSLPAKSQVGASFRKFQKFFEVEAEEVPLYDEEEIRRDDNEFLVLDREE